MVIAILAVIFGITLVATASAARKGMCGDGDFRPSCGMFAIGLNIYAMTAVSAIATLTTLAAYVIRRRPPVLLKAASIFSIVAVLAAVLPVWAAGNKLAGAIVLMITAPFILALLGGASFCVLLWLGKTIGGYIERRASRLADLPHAG